MKVNRKIILGLAATILIIAGVLFVGNKKGSSIFSKADSNRTDDSTLSETEVYAHPDGNFTFRYPKGFTSTALVETDESGKELGENIIFRGKDEKENFQIYISEFDSSPVTIASIKKDIPGIVIEDAYDIFIDGISGAAFIDVNKESGLKTREIWFSHNSKLYQITTYPEFDVQMTDILTSWKWVQQ